MQLGSEAAAGVAGPHSTPAASHITQKTDMLCCRVVQAVCGGTHTIALTDEGRIFIWGRGSFGARPAAVRLQELPALSCILFTR